MRRKMASPWFEDAREKTSKVSKRLFNALEGEMRVDTCCVKHVIVERRRDSAGQSFLSRMQRKQSGKRGDRKVVYNYYTS